MRPDYAEDGIPKAKSPILPWVIEVKKDQDIEGMRAAGRVARYCMRERKMWWQTDRAGQGVTSTGRKQGVCVCVCFFFFVCLKAAQNIQEVFFFYCFCFFFNALDAAAACFFFRLFRRRLRLSDVLAW